MAFYTLTNNLNYILFQKNPSLYLASLKDLRYNLELTENQKNILIDIINDTSEYNTYFSSPILWVVKATGTLTTQHDIPLFTSDMNLTQEEGKEMFKLLMELGASLDIKDYYGLSARNAINEYTIDKLGLLHRKNNEEFINYTKQFL